MEHPPRRSPDEEPHGPEAEQLYRGEIDLTGVVQQDDALADVISDAIAEAGDDGLPEWGARTLARALANERDDPISGALHHFAVTGCVEDRDRLLSELVAIDLGADEQLHEWVNWLGTYVIRMPEQAAPAEHADDQGDQTLDLSMSFGEFTSYVHDAFNEADAHGEPITGKAARAVAIMLAVYLEPRSEMARFADTGDANPVLLHEECRFMRRVAEVTPGMATWIEHFEQHLASRSDLGRQPQPLEPTGSDSQNEPPAREDQLAEELEIPVFGSPIEQVSAYLRIAFADARGEPITDDDAQTVATLLAALLGPTSEMSRFAESGKGDPLDLLAECRHIHSRTWQTPDVGIWAGRFERYLQAPETPPTPPEPAAQGNAEPEHHNPQVQQGITEHGDAFRAFLQLRDIDPSGDDLLQSFHNAYLGSAESMPDLLDVVRDEMADAADQEGLDLNATDDAALERSVHMAYDIAELDGRLYLFSK